MGRVTSRVELLEKDLRLRYNSRVERLAGGAGGQTFAGHVADGPSHRQGEPTGRDDNAGPERKGIKDVYTSSDQKGKGGVDQRGIGNDDDVDDAD